jgi:hypothetical protein
MRETTIPLIDGNGSRQEARVGLEISSRYVSSVGRSERICRLTLRWEGGTVIGTAEDCFSALCRIREQLEQDGLRPVCYGASRNVILRSADRDLGLGRKVYRTEIGRPLRKEDLVDILESGEDVEPVTVEEQRAFQEEWYRTPERRHPPKR